MKFVSHRGYSAKYHANTIPAFEASVAHPECGRRLTGIETDIRATSDGKLAVFHDNSLKVGGVECLVESITYNELRATVAANAAGAVVPILDELFDCVGHKLELLVEIKDAGYDKRRFFDALEAAIRRYNPKGDVILHSFSAGIMEEAVRRFSHPAVRFGALFGNAKELSGFSPALLSKMDFIHPHWQGLIDEEAKFRALGRPFNVWTVNNPADLAALKKLSCVSMITAVMTDDLALMEQCGASPQPK